MASSYRVYQPDDRPDVEVLIDDLWLIGELRAWNLLEDGTWAANVQYRPASEPTRLLANVPAHCVRQASDPYAGRRTGTDGERSSKRR